LNYKIYVDGQEGTTGLMIAERLAARALAADNIEILKIAPDKRKDEAERARYLNAADVVFLCLPDAAAIDAVKLIYNHDVRVIDASTAHRTAKGWAYGLPELSEKHREQIKYASRVSVPGCFATGFNLIAYPLVKEGLLPADFPFYCHSVTGYSGGGRKMIVAYKDSYRDASHDSPCFYRLDLNHKHLPEMQAVPGLKTPPLFTPIVADFYKGMTVAVPIYTNQLPLGCSLGVLREFFSKYYAGYHFVKTITDNAEAGLFKGDYLPATGCNDTNRVELFVFGNAEQALIVARLDNLGKGSSGAAVQCLNIMLNEDERLGLIV